MLSFFTKRRFKPLDLVLAILLAGWIPSILMALVAYTILTRTLESRIVVDRRTLVETLAQLIGYDLSHTAGVMEYYQTLPLTERMVMRPFGDPAAADWLADVYYSHPRIDGIFLADSSGRLVAALPNVEGMAGEDFASEKWISGATASKTSYVSPVFLRPQDKRLSAFVVVPVHAKSGELTGFMGASMLVDRIGRRLANSDFGEESTAQVIDQRAFPLFDAELRPTESRSAQVDEALMASIVAAGEERHFSLGGNLYTFSHVDETGWTALLKQPVAVAYRPVRELLTKTALLATWLILGTAGAAALVGWLYRRQIEFDEELARETFFNERILANMPIGVALIDPVTQRFLKTNSTFLDMAREFGGLAAGRNLAEARFSEIDLGAQAMLERVLGDGTPYEAREHQAVSVSGEQRYLSTTLLRLQEAQLRVHGVLFLVEDKTPDVSIRRELMAANTAKDQFLALLSHELRNPLTPVITAVAEIETQSKGAEEMRHPLDVIRRNVELEARLIDDLLDVTRISYGKLQLNPEVVDAHEAIRRALEICRPDIEPKEIEIVTGLNAAEFYVKADPARLQQVFWNLIKNAIKFTPAGRIAISSRNSNGKLLVTVADTGMGIDPERVGKIFNAFEQGESWITRRFGGLGLGLAISKAMIEAHGGHISVRSEGKDTGATFSIELDTVAAPEPARAVPAPQPVAANNDGRRRILLVDDHADTCAGMKRLLETRGYRVHTAHTVTAALELVDREGFDVLISDLGLPDGSGFDLMREVHQRQGIPGIALSGYGMETDIEKSREAGFTEHLIKPVNVERLETLLGQL